MGTPPERTGLGRTVPRAVSISAIVFVLMLLHRVYVVPLLPELDTVLATALAAGAAGGIASWVVSLGGKS